MTSLRFSIGGISLSGKGLSGWAHCRQWLSDGSPPGPAEPLRGTLLSPRERRRAPVTVRQALAVAEDACRMAGIAPGELPGIFASGMGDLDITHYMCGVLAETPALISPTRFHNSVHNAAAGYWSIGAGTHADVSAVCAYTDSFAAGLLEAALRCVLDDTPVLLVCYDISAGDGLLSEVWPVQHGFAGALVLTPPAAAALTLEVSKAPEHLPPLPDTLQTLARDNPAARLLYLLALVNGNARDMVIAPCQGPGLKVCRK